MVWYRDLRTPTLFSESEKDWTSRRLLDLRAQLSAPPPLGVPTRTKAASLIIGTWNIRDFDNNKYRHGPRRRESLFYIAETLAAFDICAIQEVNEDLGPLKKVLELMGPNWQFIATDVTVGASGNRERMVFVYDTNKVQFRNIAGEIVLPKHALLPDEQQFARTPFLVSFQAGWFKFSLCTVHIYFGSNSKSSDGYKRRVAEIAHIAEDMAKRADREKENYILLGDFNIKNTIDETMLALTDAGFQLPPELFPSNLLGTKYYDQIAFRTRKDEVTFINAGVFDYSKSVFKPDHYTHYATALPARHRALDGKGQPQNVADDKKYYTSRWRTWQMSDHLPLWVELAIDFSDEHLQHNLSDIAAQENATAQSEAPVDIVKATSPQTETPAKRSRRRKAPKKPRKVKEGTARADIPLTWTNAVKIFWFMASGKADALKKLRKNRNKTKP